MAPDSGYMYLDPLEVIPITLLGSFRGVLVDFYGFGVLQDMRKRSTTNFLL